MVLIRKKTETGWWQGELSGGVSNLISKFLLYFFKIVIHNLFSKFVAFVLRKVYMNRWECVG
jgi:hypothetical protein